MVDRILIATDSTDVLDEAVERNVHANVKLIAEARSLSWLVASGELCVVGAVYSVDTGEVRFLDDRSGG
jgi:carbonic anhydrase